MFFKFIETNTIFSYLIVWVRTSLVIIVVWVKLRLKIYLKVEMIPSRVTSASYFPYLFPCWYFISYFYIYFMEMSIVRYDSLSIYIMFYWNYFSPSSIVFWYDNCSVSHRIYWSSLSRCYISSLMSSISYIPTVFIARSPQYCIYSCIIIIPSVKSCIFFIIFCI